jgi:hypothetical protein
MAAWARILFLNFCLAAGLVAPAVGEPHLGGSGSIPFEVIGEPLKPLDYDTHVVVIRTAGELAALWRQINPLATVPEVDFGHQMAILYRLGCRPNLCYSVTVDRLAVRGGTLYLEVTEHAPGQHCSCPATLGCPAVVITTIPWPHAVESVLNTVQKDCGP